MSVLLDTNILTRMAQAGHPHHDAAKRAVLSLRTVGEIFIVPQNLYEFWAVATRPAGAPNGLGMTVAETRLEINRIRSLFVLLPESPQIYREWEILVEHFDVKGKGTHDARLVAAMKVHNLADILTFNSADFARYSDLTVIDPLLRLP